MRRGGVCEKHQRWSDTGVCDMCPAAGVSSSGDIEVAVQIPATIYMTTPGTSSRFVSMDGVAFTLAPLAHTKRAFVGKPPQCVNGSCHICQYVAKKWPNG